MYSSRRCVQDVEKPVRAGVRIVKHASRSSTSRSVKNAGFPLRGLIPAKNANRIRPRIG